jgi:chromosomal replication initiator protein
MEELKQKWDLILEQLKKNFDIQDISFKTWIKPIQIYSVVGNTITLLISGDEMGYTYVENKYLTPLKVTICDVMKREYEVELISSKDVDKIKIDDFNNNRKKSSKHSNAHNSSITHNLNPNYTFDTFVVGNNNNIAHAASLAVAETPGDVYNPLFIYGGVGLGKTHLMQAIAHFIINNNPALKVLYVTSETFTNELIESVKNQKNSEFREKYRNIDVLLIDDIQFIIGKETTQEEFFHTFNALYQDRKQIVISSDRPPKEMETLNERLRTRFEMGLPVDIQIPTYETKMAIINKKVELAGYDIPYEVKDYIAKNIKSSIRELEGALTKISAFAKLSTSPITVEFAEETLKDLISPDAGRELTPELIIEIVADHFNIKPDDITSQKRNANIVYPRQIAMYLCRQMLPSTVQAIGKAFGNRDHTTVIHGSEKISKLVTTDTSVRSTVDVLIKKISPS